jgi:hypothetical protein
MCAVLRTAQRHCSMSLFNNVARSATHLPSTLNPQPSTLLFCGLRYAFSLGNEGGDDPCPTDAYSCSR